MWQCHDVLSTWPRAQHFSDCLYLKGVFIEVLFFRPNETMKNNFHNHIKAFNGTTIVYQCLKTISGVWDPQLVCRKHILKGQFSNTFSISCGRIRAITQLILSSKSFKVGGLSA